MSMIALSLSLKLLVFTGLVLNLVSILKLLLIAVKPFLFILIFLKRIGTCIMNLLKTLAWKPKLLLMIAINMLELLKILFLISMLIFVEHLDLVKRIKSKRNIVFIIGMKKLQHGTEL